VAGEVVAGRYRLLNRLGSGGMGTVWRAEDELLERAVAVKEVCIPAGLPATEVERLRRRYLREARAAARLQHENVVVVHDVISEATRVWIVMELFDTRDLAAVVREDGPLSPVAAARIGLQMLAALTAAHGAGVLHRDVKPANVLICENGRAVLTDFGVASVTGDASITATGQLIGSPAYLAPERLTGGGTGPASDLWSLGCTLYAAVEGQSPFWRNEPFAILSAITVEAVPPPRSAGPLAPVLGGLLEKHQSERWNAERTRAALERVAAGREVEESRGWGAPALVEPPEPGPADVPADPGEGPGTAPPPRAGPAEPEPPPTPRPVRRRRRARLALAVAAVVMLFAVVGVAAEFLFHPLGLPIGQHTAQAERGDLGGEPEGPVMFTHPDAGYSVVVPQEWTQTPVSERVWRFSRQSSDGAAASTMNIYVETRPAAGQSSLEIATGYDRKWSADDKGFPRYQRIDLDWMVYGEYRGAVLEFTYRNPNSGPRHVMIFRTVARDVSYEISLNGPTDQFEASRPIFEQVASSLRIPE
jgi:serine/threonine protein kinase